MSSSVGLLQHAVVTVCPSVRLMQQVVLGYMVPVAQQSDLTVDIMGMNIIIYKKYPGKITLKSHNHIKTPTTWFCAICTL